jgi:uncharacterized protein HemY
MEKLPATGNNLGSVQHEKAWLRGDLALVLSQQGKRAEAEQEYRKALEMREKLVADAPDQADYLDGMARLLATCAVEKLRDSGRAVKLAREAVELSPESPDYRDTLGIALYRSGEWQAAAEALEAGLKLRDKDDATAHTGRLFLGMAFGRLARQAEARRLYAATRDAVTTMGPSAEERLFLAEAAALLEKAAPSRP